MAEALSSDYDWNVTSTNIAGSISAGITKYDLTVEHIKGVVIRLFILSSAGQSGSAGMETEWHRLEPALAFALLDFPQDRKYEIFPPIAMNQCAQSSKPETMAVLQLYRTEQLTRQFERAADKMIQDLDAPGFKK